MALYWPEEKVALDIIDDPYRNPFEGDDSYTVLRVTCADLCDYDSYRKVMGRLCELLGRDMPSMPGWEEGNRTLHALYLQQVADEIIDDRCYPFPDFFCEEEPTNVEIVATSEEDAQRMREAARNNGSHVRGVSVWNGPVPEGSFETISSNMRMSTPEYFFLCKANQLPFAEAVCMGMELCGKYRTSLTQYNRVEGYDFLQSPRTSKDTLRHYLRDVRGTKEGKRAKRVLRYVADECGSPMSCYLYLLLCLPRSRGSYGLGRAIPSVAFRSEEGFMPGSSGRFLAYDLCWPKKQVAVQFVGDNALPERDLEALKFNGMNVVCMSSSDIADPKRFDRLAQKVAKLLGVSIPETTDSWVAERNKLRKQVPVPTYDHMLLTMDDFSEHRSW